MRAHPPVTRVVDQQIIVSVGLTAADGSELPVLETTLPVGHADLLDASATPALPVLAAVAAARGEDLVVEGPVDARRLDGARRLADLLAARWNGPPVRIDADVAATSPADAGSGVGLFFTRGVDSWSTLLDVLDAPDGRRVTRLYAVQHAHGPHRRVDAEIIAGHRRVAADLDLDLVVLSTTARSLLDRLQPWVQFAGPALASAGLTAAADLGRLVLSGAGPARLDVGTSLDAIVFDTLRDGPVDLVMGNPDRTRAERVAHLLGHRRARSTLQVCWEGLTAGNCGRCPKCQITLAELVLAGDPDPTAGFDHGPDPDVVAGVDLATASVPMVEALVAGLPSEHEHLRRAWGDALARSRGEPTPERWGGDAAIGLAGPDVATRVAAALRASTGNADHPPAPPLGWTRGAVALRPAPADQARARTAAADIAERPLAWAVVESQIRDGGRDGAQAGLALRLQAAHGRGVAYFPQILWAHLEPPALDAAAVRAVLGTVRARFWWRDDGDLDPLRLVETIEAGCLPIQVMPPGAAEDLRSRLPAALTGVVVGDDELAWLDLSGPAAEARLRPALDHVLAGNPEHDLLIGAHGG